MSEVLIAVLMLCSLTKAPAFQSQCANKAKECVLKKQLMYEKDRLLVECVKEIEK